MYKLNSLRFISQVFLLYKSWIVVNHHVMFFDNSENKIDQKEAFSRINFKEKVLRAKLKHSPRL